MKNIKTLLYPRSIAVIGASRNPQKIGHIIFKNILQFGFSGPVFPVNPKAKTILQKQVFPSVKDIKKPVDLAIIVVPAPIVPQVLKEAGEKKVKTAIIISAGFGETGKEGQKREEEVVQIARRFSMAVLGPNCLGIINPQINLNASWGGDYPQRGNVAFISQSGAIFSPLVELLTERKIGFSYLISLGNKADINENDLLEFLKKDKKTEIIIAYLESFKEGKKFIRIAQETSPKKPIIILKSGITSLGARAAQSHTASLATPQKTIQAAMKQANVVYAQDLRSLLNITTLASSLIKMKKKIAPETTIVTNAGGPSILATDALASSSLSLKTIPPSLEKKLRTFLPPIASLKNPIDILGDADEKRYQKTIKAIIKSRAINNILVILTKQTGTKIKETARVCSSINKSTKKIIIGSFIGGESFLKAKEIFQKNSFVNFSFPKEAVYALDKINRWEKNKKKPLPKLTPSRFHKKTFPANLLQKGLLSPSKATRIIEAYGIETPPATIVRNYSQAKTAAQKIGYPLFLKTTSRDIIHKTEAGGIVRVENNQELRQALASMADLKGNKGFLLQKAVEEGIELILGAKKDPSFGHITMVGAGGIYTETLKDTSVRIAPINKDDAQEMLEELKIYPLLKGARGKRGVNLEKIKQYLLAISLLVTDFPQIEELDINPLICNLKTAIAVDIKIILSPHKE